MRISSFMKPVAALAIASLLATSFVSAAEAGHRNNAGKLLLGLGLGLAVGTIISNHNRHNSGIYYSTYDNGYDDDGYQSCYRAKRVVCDTRLVCKRDGWGHKRCFERENCYRPLICN